jgi:dTDP-4-amino-4,6-dideoxy-D-galactose acyltransferase
MSLSASNKTAFYSPYSFLGKSDLCATHFLSCLEEDLALGKAECFDSGYGVAIYFRELPWDTEFFGLPTFRVDYTTLSVTHDVCSLQNAFIKFREYLSSQYPEYYCFAEVPVEDSNTLLGMSSAAWRLIETRITCFRDDLQQFDYPTRSVVRKASESDISELRRVAKEAVNIYDRFHADDFFSKNEADEFLATFIENSVRGFADEVIVPGNGPANAFLTGNYVTPPSSISSMQMGKMVLSAVSSERRGWYVRLIAELSLIFRGMGINTVFMTTQATNRAVLKVWFRHGYRFGRCTHIFSTYSRMR